MQVVQNVATIVNVRFNAFLVLFACITYSAEAQINRLNEREISSIVQSTAAKTAEPVIGIWLHNKVVSEFPLKLIKFHGDSAFIVCASVDKQGLLSMQSDSALATDMTRICRLLEDSFLVLKQQASAMQEKYDNVRYSKINDTAYVPFFTRELFYTRISVFLASPLLEDPAFVGFKVYPTDLELNRHTTYGTALWLLLSFLANENYYQEHAVQVMPVKGE
ncbi:MAG: hypothetical protein RL660_63 [Bacteroidota bacterium]